MKIADTPSLAATIVALTGGVFVVLGVVAPTVFHALLQEDSWAEWATFAAFATASVRFAMRARALGGGDEPGTSGERWTERAVLLSLALFCFFVAGEEISWAQRVLAFRPPDIFLEQNFQQELNLHNFLKGKEVGGAKLDSRYLVAAAAFGYGVVAPALRALFERTSLSRGLLASAARPAPPEALIPLFVGVVAFELSYPLELTGEAAELVLGLCFVAAVPPHGARGGGLVAFSLVLGGALSALVPALLYGSDERREQQAERALTELSAALSGGDGITEKLRNKGRVHKRLFTAEKAGYLALPGEPAFHLDPWSNPYWLHWSKKQQRLLLYSFGSNRKRDLTPGAREPGDRGDDIVVTVPLSP